jgi:hypothetical protein
LDQYWDVNWEADFQALYYDIIRIQTIRQFAKIILDNEVFQT